jgi:hypothetical protein
LKDALDDGSELRMLQILLDLMELPLTAMYDLLREEPKAASAEKPPQCVPDLLPTDVAPAQKAAVRRAYQDEATFEDMKAMHRSRDKPLRPHEPRGPQTTVTTKKAKGFLYKLATNDNACMDVFGWAADYLLHVRKTPFLTQLARLLAKIVNADVPDSYGIVLTCGMLLPLHKETPAEQKERIKKGERPKLRPVNVGVSLLKWAFKLALTCKAAQRTAKRLSNIQMALGVKRGVEKVAHLFRALWHKRYAILSIDFVNGFNDMRRQAMLDAVQDTCPELTSLFNLFYARDSLCFFMVEGSLRTILGQEGSRMGCVLGSFGFDIVAQKIYE